MGSLTVTTRDPLGFFSRRRNLGEPQNILILPATLELPYFELLSQHDSRYGGSRPWLINQVNANVAGVREYIAGDSLRHIHWHSTAHIGKPLVKVFDADRSLSTTSSIWIVADMHSDSYKENGNPDTEEHCITIAASLIKKYMDSGWSVGLIAAGDQYYLFPPVSGEQYLGRMLTALALMKATGDIPIGQLVANESGRFVNNSALIAITPSSSEKLVASLRQVKSRGRLVAAILLDSLYETTDGITNAALALSSSGLQGHVVRRGDDLAQALDSRDLLSRIRYITDHR